MADVLTPTINLIRTCTAKYTDFCAFEEECTMFRRSLIHVVEVLTDFQKDLPMESPSPSNNTSLQRPLELLQTATKDGGDVLKHCCSKRRKSWLSCSVSS